MKIYLSPSKQPHNKYAYGNTNEQEQMERLAREVKASLSTYDVDVAIATLSLGIENRDNEAKNLNANLYLALHSNSTGTSYNQAVGTVAFYHPDAPITKTLGNNLIDSLGEVIPFKENRYEQLINGMLAFNRSGYHEVREPMKLGVPALLLEVDFHDNPKVAEFLVNNTKTVANAIAKGIVKTYDLKLKPIDKPITKPVEGDKMYKIQIGAYSVKANADRALKEAIAKGYKDAYIVETGSVSKPSEPIKPTIREGVIVSIRKGAKSYEGKSIASWVFNQKYRVDELKGDRAVLDKQGIYTAFNIKDLMV